MALDDKTRDELAELALKLAGGPKRKEFLKLTKEQYPGTSIPELDLEDSLSKRVEEATKPLQEKLQAMEQNKLKEEMQAERRSIQQQYQLSDEDMGKLDTMITEKKLPADYKWAGQLYKAQAQPADPTNYGSSGYGPADLPTDEQLLKNPDRWSLQQAHSLVDELRARASKSNF
jgi:hypothetical protein